MQTEFKNPYLDDIRAGKVTRLTTDVSDSDYTLIKCVRVGSGTISTTINLLWKKLCNELRTRGLTDFTSAEQFEQYVLNLRLVPGDEYEQLCIDNIRNIGDSTARRSPGEAIGQLHSGGTQGARSRPAKKANKRTNLEGGSAEDASNQGNQAS